MLVNKANLLEQVKSQIETCNSCPALVESRAKYPYGKPTFGYGNPNSKIVFIAEAPGKYGCGRTGKPFFGDRSGSLYMEALKYIGLDYEKVYTTNVVKCCPLNNRTPVKKEIEQCRRWLTSELEVIKPKMIVALGRIAANWFGIRESINTAQYKEYLWEDIKLFVLYHPAYIIRFNIIKEKVTNHYKNQFKKIKRILDGIK